MEPLYPQHVVERTFPYYREKREKAEKEFVVDNGHEKTAELFEDPPLEEELLYAEIPYHGGAVGRHLNTFA